MITKTLAAQYSKQPTLSCPDSSTVELGYNVMKGTEQFVSLYTSVVITEKHNVMVNGEELIGATQYLTLQTICRTNL
jgi:hypothetical protein